MESEVLGEEFEWNVRCMAAAFGVKDFEVASPGIDDSSVEYQGEVGDVSVAWIVEADHFLLIDVGSALGWCRVVWLKRDVFECFPHSRFNKLMVMGLYCLGIEEENLLAQLNHSLTAHEKLELRLSMPREFWPQKWRGEEGANS